MAKISENTGFEEREREILPQTGKDSTVLGREEGWGGKEERQRGSDESRDAVNPRERGPVSCFLGRDWDKKDMVGRFRVSKFDSEPVPARRIHAVWG